MAFLDILNRYAGAPQPQPDTPAHFEEAASNVSHETLGSALASMFRSSSTPDFGSTVGNLFSQSNPQQRAGLLNQLAQSLGPAALGAGGGVLGRLLGTSSAGPTPAITPEQASQVSPSEVTALATHAEQHDSSIVDNVGSFYAQHPVLVKTLGVAALAVALGHMRS